MYMYVYCSHTARIIYICKIPEEQIYCTCPNFPGAQFLHFKCFMETISSDPLLLATPLDQMHTCTNVF